MEGLIALAVVFMVVRSLYKNSREAKKKEAARRDAQGMPPAPKQPSAKFPSLPDWMDMLEGKMPERKPEQAKPVLPPQPAVPQAPASPTFGMAQGESAMELWSTVAPLMVGEEGTRPTVQEQLSLLSEPGSMRAKGEAPLSFLDQLPEVVKGVVYAEILTRPQRRRRLRP